MSGSSSSGGRYQRLDDQSRHHLDEEESAGTDDLHALETGGRNNNISTGSGSSGGGGIELSAFSRFVSPLLGGSSGGGSSAGGAYSTLGQQSEHGSNNANSNTGGELLQLKVHCKERLYELSINSTRTIAQLKQELTTLTELPAYRQRLIYSGKLLRPEDQTLASFHIPNHASIHLFPLPEIVATSSAAGAVAVDGSSNPMHASAVPTPSIVPRTGAANFPTHTPAHFDPSIQQFSREVKMWCSVLLLLSGFALFNNFSYFTSTGNFGEGALDVIVFVMDTVCSCYGIYVAKLGIKSIESMNLQDINIYVQNLGSLALGCIVLRVMWVFDVVFSVERAIKKSQPDGGSSSIGGDNDTSGDTGSGGDSTGGTGSEDSNTKPIDPNAIVSFTIQAMIIAAICVYAWGSCYFRARGLQSAVQSYHETHQIPIPAVATAQQGSTSNVPMATAVQSTNSTMFTRPPLTSNGPQGDVSNRV